MKYYLLSNNFLASILLGAFTPIAIINLVPKVFSETMTTKTGTKTLLISSEAFNENGMIPLKYTCEGDNKNPPLTIKGIPSAAVSLALLVDDPDAPKGTFVHWVSWNIPVSKTIVENKEPGERGVNGAGKKGYTGPCPPTGIHHYHFKVYALDTKLNISGDVNEEALSKSMNNHVLAWGELVGLYEKTKP